jgi:outer membrane receptor for ferrienterochelin and colicin
VSGARREKYEKSQNRKNFGDQKKAATRSSYRVGINIDFTKATHHFNLILRAGLVTVLIVGGGRERETIGDFEASVDIQSQQLTRHQIWQIFTAMLDHF